MGCLRGGNRYGFFLLLEELAGAALFDAGEVLDGAADGAGLAESIDFLISITFVLIVASLAKGELGYVLISSW